ncbi:MAG TPA: hypothetical protein PLD99_02530 [Parcubacteria group bacterium]|nr:hypothetical protein [Parcubacteria group bacterium]
MFEEEDKFPILVNPKGLGRHNDLLGYIDITMTWRDFLLVRPEAEQFVYALNPPAWTPLRAQPFQFIRNEDVKDLHERWSMQVDILLALKPTAQ